MRRADDAARRGDAAAPEALERRNRELSILDTIAEALNASVDLSGSLGRALALVAELLDLVRDVIALLRINYDRLVERHGSPGRRMTDKPATAP